MSKSSSARAVAQAQCGILDVCVCVRVLTCMWTREPSYLNGSWRPTSELSGKHPPSVLHHVPPKMRASHRGHMGRNCKDLGQVLFAAPLPMKLMGCQWWTTSNKSLRQQQYQFSLYWGLFETQSWNNMKISAFPFKRSSLLAPVIKVSFAVLN